jgi:hypothetical protein
MVSPAMCAAIVFLAGLIAEQVAPRRFSGAGRR